MSDEVLIQKINKIIKEAIEHGGDSCGAFFSNTDCLVNEMKYFLRWSGLDKDFGIMNEEGWLRFYKKKHIVE